MKNAKDALLFAAINCSHRIEGEKITLEFYPGKPGKNALNQLSARLEVAFDACTASMTARIAELSSANAWRAEVIAELRKANEVAHARSLQQALIIATLANQKAEVEAQLATEVARLDFVLSEAAFVTEFGEPNSGFQLCSPDDEFGIMDLSGDGVMHPTPRAAIDAAIGLAKGGV